MVIIEPGASSETRFEDVLAVAQLLDQQFDSVKILAATGIGRTPDILINEHLVESFYVEVKSFSSPRSLKQNILDAHKQANHIILYGIGLEQMDPHLIARILKGQANQVHFSRLAIWHNQTLHWFDRAYLMDHEKVIDDLTKLLSSGQVL